MLVIFTTLSMIPRDSVNVMILFTKILLNATFLDIYIYM
jgi:hypothetical protein